MPEKIFKRKLTSILSADAVGYSRLMEADEASTVRTLIAYRGVISALIKQHHGIVIDSPGDNILAEFASVVDAVQCAVAVQKELKARNQELPQNRRMQFRIGINLGDVIQEADRIYGDGVNIAARLEAMAEPGGICISKTAFDHIESKLPYGYEFLGDQAVKNLARPVGTYRVIMEPRVTVAGESAGKKSAGLQRRPILIGLAALLVLAAAGGVWLFYARRPPVEPASEEKMAYPLPARPSIAVLLFDDSRADPGQRYFSAGVAGQIIDSLSRLKKVFVIARHSTLRYEGQPAAVRRVAEELGIRYVLEGSLQKSDKRLKITVQLTDAITGRHLWAGHHERDLKDVFAVQDEITLGILKAVGIKLTAGEQARVKNKATSNLDAYLKALQADDQFCLMNKQGVARARELAQKAIALDPDYAWPYAILANASMMGVRFKSGGAPREAMQQARAALEKALQVDGTDPRVYGSLSNFYTMQGAPEKALQAAQKAAALSPAGARAALDLGNALLWAGRTKDAIYYCRQAIRRNPFPPGVYFRTLGKAYRLAKRYADSIIQYKKALELNADDILAHLGLIFTYAKLNRKKEARDEAAEVLRIDPDFSVDYFVKTSPIKNPSIINGVKAVLRKAGLK